MREKLLEMFGWVPAEKLWELEEKTVLARRENEKLRQEIDRVSKEIKETPYQVKRTRGSVRVRVYFWLDENNFHPPEEIARWVGKTAVKIVTQEVLR